ncbi:MAG: hypothetical protein WC483_02915 [Candidatus Paceibacterota bacterium]
MRPAAGICPPPASSPSRSRFRRWPDRRAGSGASWRCFCVSPICACIPPSRSVGRISPSRCNGTSAASRRSAARPGGPPCSPSHKGKFHPCLRPSGSSRSFARGRGAPRPGFAAARNRSGGRTAARPCRLVG